MAETKPKAPSLETDLPDEIAGILAVLDEQKGEQIVVLDMREVSGFTDHMIMCTGRSVPHVRALVDAVDEHRREEGAKPAHIEGRAEGAWVLMDYFDLLVHVFTPESREFYQLERLWRDAPLLEWVPEPQPESPPAE